MGWTEDLLQKAINTCTSESGRIEDCPLFNVVSEEKARSCEMKTKPQEIAGEKIMGGLSLLPGNVKITYEGDVAHDDNEAPSKPSPPKKQSPPKEKPSPPDDKSGGDPIAGQVFKETSVYEAPAPTQKVGVQGAAAAADPDTTSSSKPTTTSKPTVFVDPNVSYARTEYVTNGNVVSKILWEEETVTVTEMVDSTTTVTIDGGVAPSIAPQAAEKLRRHAAHLHHHGHRHI